MTETQTIDLSKSDLNPEQAIIDICTVMEGKNMKLAGCFVLNHLLMLIFQD